MKVDLKCFATLANPETCDFKESTSYELDEGQTVEHLIQAADLNEDDVAMAFVNSKVVDLSTALSDGDKVGLTPKTAALKKTSAFQQ